MNIITHHKHEETIIPEDLKDTDMSSGGMRPNFEDYRVQIEEEKEDLSLSKKMRNANKASITSENNFYNTF